MLRIFNQIINSLCISYQTNYQKLNKFSKSKNSHTINKFQNEQYKTIKYITVKGMGKTIEKVASIGTHFQKGL